MAEHRCEWCGSDPEYVAYHDEEWGVAVHDDKRLFEMLTLEGAQAGLSWLTILKKRPNYFRAFDGWDLERIAGYAEHDVQRLLGDAGIVRNRLKIESVVTNARAALAVREEFGSLDAYLWLFVDGTPLQNHLPSVSELPASTQRSDAMSKDMKARGFKFVGSTICYAFMQAVGMVNDHTVDCFRHQPLVNAAKAYRKAYRGPDARPRWWRIETSSMQDVRGMYDGTAQAYAEMMDAEIDLPVYADVLGRLVGRIGSVPGPIIDTACGPGHMLQRYHLRHDPGRALVGVDLSERMVEIARERLSGIAEVLQGDMRDLGVVLPGAAASVWSFFALHHLEPEQVLVALREWHRVMRPGGQLLIATWEGSGTIDYGDAADLVALRYTAEELEGWAVEAGFQVDRCAVEPVEEMPMDAIYLEATKG